MAGDAPLNPLRRAGLPQFGAPRRSDAMSKRSVELREEAKAKHALVSEVLRLAGSDRDFSKKEVLEKLGAADSADAVKRFRTAGAEAHDAFQKAADAELDEEIRDHQDRDDELKRTKGAGGRHPPPEAEEPSLGRLFTEHKVYAEGWRKERQTGVAEIPFPLKTLVTTGAGFAPRPPRIPDVVPFAVRPIQFLDLIPISQTTDASIIYMEKTTYTISAAELAEAGTYPESTYVWTERTSTVRKIADSIPVTDEQLDDVPQMQSLHDGDLRFGVRQKLDGEVIVGPGTGVTLTGIVNVSGIQTQARST